MDPRAAQSRFVYLDHRYEPLRPLPEFTYYFRDPVTLPLSTAVGLSARFPIVTPAGSIAMFGRKRRYVDGGYFENSGTATLVELVSLLESLRSAKAETIDKDSFDVDRWAAKFKIFVLVISANTCLDAADRGSAEKCEEGDLGAGEDHSFGETLSPIRTLLNTRSSRAGISRRQLEWYIAALNQASQPQSAEDFPEGGVGVDSDFVKIAEFQLRRRDVRLPLSWLLSKSARADISAQVSATAGIGGGVAPDATNLQPDPPSNKRSFNAVLTALAAHRPPEARRGTQNSRP